MAKRKSRKNKKQPKKSGFFFLILIIFIGFCIYSYKTNQEFRAYADDAIEQVSDLTRSKLEEIQPRAEDEMASYQSPQDKASKNNGNLIYLSPGLERPICRAKNHDKDHEIRNFTHYSICYRESYEQAEWSAYCLTEEELVKNASRSNDFRPDPQISTGSASLADYRKSGYDRGHLSPAADFAFDSKAMSETFYMSNMSPQIGGLNRGIWKDLESQVRVWAKTFGRVYVVSGPVLEKPASEYSSIGENKVSVPDFYYKVILAPIYKDENDRMSPDDASSVASIAFIFPNEKCSGELFDYAVTIDEVEERTKLDFFSLLDDEIEEQIESRTDLF